MNAPNAAFREDLIQNAVNHQTKELEENGLSPGTLEALFNSELNHDLLIWPRQYLETYLDSDESGRVPLTPEQLQDHINYSAYDGAATSDNDWWFIEKKIKPITS